MSGTCPVLPFLLLHKPFSYEINKAVRFGHFNHRTEGQNPDQNLRFVFLFVGNAVSTYRLNCTAEKELNALLLVVLLKDVRDLSSKVTVRGPVCRRVFRLPGVHSPS